MLRMPKAMRTLGLGLFQGMELMVVNGSGLWNRSVGIQGNKGSKDE